MQINGPNGVPAEVTPDNRIKVVSIIQTDINAQANLGKAWTLPFTQAAVDATDNVVFHIKNDSDESIDMMRLLVSNAIAGLWTIEYGREYSAGGTPITIRQLNVTSGKTQDITAYYGQNMTLTGTAVDSFYMRVGVDDPTDMLNYGPIIIEPSGTVAVKFFADSGTPSMAVTPIIHAAGVWE